MPASNLQDSKSIFMMTDFKIFLIMLVIMLNFGALLACHKKRGIFSKNFRIRQFLDQILQIKLLRIQNKVRFCVKKLKRTTKIQEKVYSLNHISGLYYNQKRYKIYKFRLENLILSFFPFTGA